MRRAHRHLPIILGATALLASAGVSSASPAGAGRGSRLTVREQETIRKTFDLSATAAARSLEVDNVTGSIEVVGTDSNQVQLVVNKTIRAESQAKIEQAKKEVTLEITAQPDSLKLYVDGPFRCRCDRHSISFHGDEGYVVEMDFQLQVPRKMDITLRTVNEGHILVREVTGRYSVHNVNGGIEMLQMAGAGQAETVNGAVKVTFRENPRENSSFESVNGDIDLYFSPSLSADFRFKTFNGEVYSDFPVTSLPTRAMEKERAGGKNVFRADRFTSGRVGSGGIEVTVENLNGDIRIRENHE